MGKNKFPELDILHQYTIQVCTFHDGCKQAIDQQIFNRKSISRKITIYTNILY